ncbi:AAA family ATPase [Roseinatronobacter sp.]|uniref:AAA family ATPase n=1 Tax=Roseinatronobacter sp. TaxID=1945755 RepID=UPI003F6F357E
MPSSGKSFLAVGIALSVATGTPFHGRDTKQGAVFFIAGEGRNGLARRFAAWGMVLDDSQKCLGGHGGQSGSGSPYMGCRKFCKIIQ